MLTNNATAPVLKRDVRVCGAIDPFGGAFWSGECFLCCRILNRKSNENEHVWSKLRIANVLLCLFFSTMPQILSSGRIITKDVFCDDSISAKITGKSPIRSKLGGSITPSSTGVPFHPVACPEKKAENKVLHRL